MKKNLFFITLFLAINVSYGFNPLFNISPQISIVKFDLNKDVQSITIKVKNKNNVKTTFIPRMLDVYVDKNKQFNLNNYILNKDLKFTLEPKETKEISLLYKIPKELKGDFLGQITYSLKYPSKTSLRTDFGVIAFLIIKNGEIDDKFLEFDSKENKKNGYIDLNLKIKNKTNHIISSYNDDKKLNLIVLKNGKKFKTFELSKEKESYIKPGEILVFNGKIVESLKGEYEFIYTLSSKEINKVFRKKVKF